MFLFSYHLLPHMWFDKKDKKVLKREPHLLVSPEIFFGDNKARTIEDVTAAVFWGPFLLLLLLLPKNDILFWKHFRFVVFLLGRYRHFPSKKRSKKTKLFVFSRERKEKERETKICFRAISPAKLAPLLQDVTEEKQGRRKKTFPKFDRHFFVNSDGSTIFLAFSQYMIQFFCRAAYDTTKFLKLFYPEQT